MGALIRYKDTDKPVAAQDRRQPLPSVQSLLHEWNKLIVGEDGILRRKSGSSLQIDTFPKAAKQKMQNKRHGI